MKKILKFLPKFLRIKLIRQNIEIAEPPEGFIVNIATTREELEKAYSLLHDCYVDIKLMGADPSGLRCNVFSFLPVTTTIVAKIGDVVVGTVSLIKDSSAGLPSDKDFRTENDQLRAEGCRLVEVSSLAIDHQFRKKAHIVSLYLMKYLQHYCTHFMGCTTVTCVIHPRARDFYAAFWSFKSNKKIIKYKFVNGALGAHVFGNITNQTLAPTADLFPKETNRNPISFLFRHDNFLIYPTRKFASLLDPIYTPDLLTYFMAERTDAYKTLTRSELSDIYTAYAIYFKNLEKIEFFKELNLVWDQLRPFRYLCCIQALITFGNLKFGASQIMDLHYRGAFIATEVELEINKEYNLEFDMGSYKYSARFIPAWRNHSTRNHQRLGYGIKFMEAQLGVARLLKHTHVEVQKRLAS